MFMASFTYVTSYWGSDRTISRGTRFHACLHFQSALASLGKLFECNGLLATLVPTDYWMIFYKICNRVARRFDRPTFVLWLSFSACLFCRHFLYLLLSHLKFKFHLDPGVSKVLRMPVKKLKRYFSWFEWCIGKFIHCHSLGWSKTIRRQYRQ